MGRTVEGSVLATGGGVYTVQLDDGSELRASLRGRLKQKGGPVVIGDRVVLLEGEGVWTVESVQDRTTELVRRGRGGRSSKVLAANLDRVFAVVALREPAVTHQLIDRLLALAESNRIPPVLIMNKLDLESARATAEELAELYEGVGYRVLAVSALSGEGLEQLRETIRVGSSALIGPSGVGKSSLLNALDPALELRTGELSGKGGGGRHTTVSSRLIRLRCGGLVADTPGFSDVALWGIAPDDVGDCFPEFERPSAGCRFRSCTHLAEPECGVREAVEEGRIRESRYESYLRLREEAQEA